MPELANLEGLRRPQRRAHPGPRPVPDRGPAIVDAVGRRGPVHECNFALLVPDYTSDEALAAGQMQAAYAGSPYQEALRSQGIQGGIVLERVGAVSFKGDHASIGGRAIHVVMTQSPTARADADLWAQSPLLDLVARGCVVAMNGPDCSMISNKIVLALLCEAAEAGRLGADDTALIRSALPWTRQVKACKVERNGQQHWLPDLLVSARDEFVLKPGEGFGGDGVCIGRNTAAADWERAVASALRQGTWVAQEAAGGTPMWFLGEREQLVPHNVNLSIVVTGDEYVGAFLRLMPVASPDALATVGYALGALSGGVVEVEG